MQPVRIQNIRYADRLAKEKFRRKIAGIVGGVILGSSLFALGAYLFFFSPILEIQSITASGLEKVSDDEVLARVREQIHQKKFLYFEPFKNILVFNSAAMRDRLLASYPSLKTVTIQKDFPHGLALSFVEREPLGVWCFGRECLYFDADGALWGPAPQSSGSLLTIVRDERQREIVTEMDRRYVTAVQEIASGLKAMGVPMRDISIPPGIIGDIHANTMQGYPLFFSLDSDIPAQLDVLRIFLDQKGDQNFKPQYLDLRIRGRVYYK